jgi:hypothetical protein
VKTIYERIRAQQAKRDAKPAPEFKRQMKLDARLERADLKRCSRIDALIAGTAEPRNAEEQRIVDRANDFDFYE